jgi:ABC-type bacteriocin/lantibiotic exporter with double-glycine peptidase domain
VVSSGTRTNFSYVPQGNTLFYGTIRENLQLANQSVTEAEMTKALKVACADYVFNLPKGLDTPVSESGYGLSEGQAQRIAIARALLHDSAIWVFDEATSALDSHTAAQLIPRLMEAGKEKILIFVTHDPMVMRACKQLSKLY